MSTTTSEQIPQVRARLADMRALCKATNLPGNLQSRNSSWYQVGDWCLSEAGSDEDAAFIAAASPALLLRLVAHAENVLDRHVPMDRSPECCAECQSEIPIYPPAWPCPEVEAVIKAWTS